jgi:hypothetical protein
MALTARPASSAPCTRGTISVVAPASSTRLNSTASLPGSLTIGTSLVALRACSIATTPGSSSGECSMSSTAQSKPAWPMASATSGLADMIQVPSGTRWWLARGCASMPRLGFCSSCLNAFIAPSPRSVAGADLLVRRPASQGDREGGSAAAARQYLEPGPSSATRR